MLVSCIKGSVLLFVLEGNVKIGHTALLTPSASLAPFLAQTQIVAAGLVLAAALKAEINQAASNRPPLFIFFLHGVGRN